MSEKSWQLPSLIAEIDGHYQIYELLPDMEYWGGWPCYFVRSVGFVPEEPHWFVVPRNNPGVANWYNRERLPYVPQPATMRILPKERARALALLWMRGGTEFESLTGKES